MYKHIREIRIYPLEHFVYPTVEYAKLCIGNGFDSYSSLSNLHALNGGNLELYGVTLFLFQYESKIIAKGTVYIEQSSWGGFYYYLDDIVVLDEGITSKDLKNVFGKFKKFNSSAQRIPLEYLSEILELFNEKRKMENIELGEKDSFFCNRSEGNRIEYYVTKYERNPQYREQAIKIHGLTCQICEFNFEEDYGSLGKGYIEVHHRKPLYTLDEEIVPNPESDMICVCSNCHRMLHRYRDSIISPEELRTMLENRKKKQE